uniref:ERCC4 domain-containing protein n=1 Tax=Esox lucius TaxID=8010 RepID=A0AAY5KN83_ESOLU
MSVLKRANTWEISDSEGESDAENKQAIKCLAFTHQDDDSKETATASCCTDEKNNKDDNTDCKTEPIGDALVAPQPTQSGTPSPRRKRRTKEEIELDKQRAEERKDAREKLKRERDKEKRERREEQQRRKEAAERLKSFRPENCLKCLTVRLDPALLQDDGSDVLLGTLSALEWTSSIETQLLTRSITWTRDLPQGEDCSGPVEEEQVMLVSGVTDFLDVVNSVQQTLRGNGEESGGDSFFNLLSKCLNQDAKMVVTLLVMGSNPNNWTEMWDGYESNQRSQLGMEDLDIEEVLVYLQLYWNVSVVFMDNWQEVTDHISFVTKALSKRPYRLLTQRCELPFCVDGSWASGARVERDGSRLREVWSRQINQLNRVSTAVASTVTTAYPSPLLLLQAYNCLESEEEKRGLLAGLLVRTGGKERRVGPDISARVYRSLTAQNAQLVLD